MFDIREVQFECEEALLMSPNLPEPVLQEIRALAIAEWPGDFERQIYLIDSQSEAWFELQEWADPDRADAELIGPLLDDLRMRWPGNYELQLIHLHAQMDGRHALEQIRTLYADVPPNVLATICCQAARTIVDDFELLHYSVANQVEAWRRLNQRDRLEPLPVPIQQQTSMHN